MSFGADKQTTITTRSQKKIQNGDRFNFCYFHSSKSFSSLPAGVWALKRGVMSFQLWITCRAADTRDGKLRRLSHDLCSNLWNVSFLIWTVTLSWPLADTNKKRSSTQKFWGDGFVNHIFSLKKNNYRTNWLSKTGLLSHYFFILCLYALINTNKWRAISERHFVLVC